MPKYDTDAAAAAWLPVWRLIFTAADELRRRQAEGHAGSEKPAQK